jgi:hypothetical protein
MVLDMATQKNIFIDTIILPEDEYW